ncbi:hypothetical protein FHX42_000341 [Saccharopolyspora lacisalsi]|uniref:Uncharacterized protein n=1 Tax=Halosaccharopolyspora lacisalsi TaxID=1000566 RepID=A0A839DM21_9PSEU|nr:hypothetical protein [Halosaccharopolyspora lacisalsi]MBA8823012.1 hypothetical protein [Halosaccharopolyspora lacisalsi]
MNDDGVADLLDPDGGHQGRVDDHGMLVPEQVLEAFPESAAAPRETDEAPQESVGDHHDVSARGDSVAVDSISGSGVTVAKEVDHSRDKRINSPEFNLYSSAEEILEVARSADPGARRREWDADALRKSAENYVVPQGLLEPEERSAYRVLTSRRHLAITAPVDRAGHEAAALRLAHEVRKRSVPDLVVCKELVDRDFRLTAKTLLRETRPCLVILDLRDALDSAVDRVCNGLTSFVEELEPRNGYLVLLLPHGQRRRFDDEFPARAHELGRPPAPEVLSRHLRGVDDSADLLEQSRLTAYLEQAWPPRATELACWVSEIAERGETDSAELARQACGVVEDWSGALREEIAAHQQEEDVEWLSLLLAAALLEGARPQQIVAASDRLLRRLEHRPPEAESLLRPGVVTTLRKLGSTVFDVERSRFERPHYGESVLRHFWSEHPMLRRSIRDWMAELRVGGLHRRDLERVADRTTELARVTGSRVAIDLARRWATPEGGSSAGAVGGFDGARRSIAVRLLTNTALDATTGRHVRDKLYDWAQRGTSPELGLVVAEVCGGAMSVEFPRVALTRLKLLAASENEAVHAAVVEALTSIAGHLGPPGFLRYLAEWFDRAEPIRLATLAEGIDAVLALAVEGDALSPDFIDAAEVRIFWRRALDDMPLEESRRVLAAWLRPATSVPETVRERMVEVLVEATEHQPHRIQRLYYASRIATPSSEAPGTDPLGDVVQQMWTRLDEVDPLRA